MYTGDDIPDPVLLLCFNLGLFLTGTHLPLTTALLLNICKKKKFSEASVMEIRIADANPVGSGPFFVGSWPFLGSGSFFVGSWPFLGSGPFLSDPDFFSDPDLFLSDPDLFFVGSGPFLSERKKCDSQTRKKPAWPPLLICIQNWGYTLYTVYSTHC